MFCVAGGRKCGEGYGACQGGARCHAEQGPNARGTAESYPGISAGGGGGSRIWKFLSPFSTFFTKFRAPPPPPLNTPIKKRVSIFGLPLQNVFPNQSRVSMYKGIIRSLFGGFIYLLQLLLFASFMLKG